MQARKSTDREERRELYIQLQDKILEQRVQLPAWNTVETWGVRDEVQDMSLHPIPVENPRLVTDYQNVWLDQ
jgi:peptide/nickel transport system substrate-binding protein